MLRNTKEGFVSIILLLISLVIVGILFCSYQRRTEDTQSIQNQGMISTFSDTREAASAVSTVKSINAEIQEVNRMILERSDQIMNQALGEN